MRAPKGALCEKMCKIEIKKCGGGTEVPKVLVPVCRSSGIYRIACALTRASA